MVKTQMMQNDDMPGEEAEGNIFFFTADGGS